jgi:hypothetical protein
MKLILIVIEAPRGLAPRRAPRGLAPRRPVRLTPLLGELAEFTLAAPAVVGVLDPVDDLPREVVLAAEPKPEPGPVPTTLRGRTRSCVRRPTSAAQSFVRAARRSVALSDDDRAWLDWIEDQVKDIDPLLQPLAPPDPPEATPQNLKPFLETVSPFGPSWY